MKYLTIILLLASCSVIATENQEDLAEDPLEGITIEPENRCSPYERYSGPFGSDVESRISAQQGGLFSPYSMRCFTSERDVDIEHIVAASEAHDSGMCAHSRDKQTEFASDFLNLTHAAPALNRYEKSAKDAAEWLPEHNQCWYVYRIIEVKRKYGLSVDAKEAKALRSVLRSCKSTKMEIPACASG